MHTPLDSPIRKVRLLGFQWCEASGFGGPAVFLALLILCGVCHRAVGMALAFALCAGLGMRRRFALVTALRTRT
eukprot:5699201-Alexandrium_andersonii.AAC.1